MPRKKKRHGLSFLAIHAERLRLELETVRDYIAAMRSSLAAQQTAFGDHMEAQRPTMSPEEFDMYRDHVSDRYWQLVDDFPALMRDSTFVALISLTERELKRLCALVQEGRGVATFKEGKGRGSTLEKARDYIKSHTGIDVGSHRKWKTMLTLNRIRNAIVHAGGRVKPAQQDEIRSYAHGNRKLLKVTSAREPPANRVVLKDGFPEHTLKIMDDYFASAYKKLRPLDI